jgi:plastocyanin
LQALERGSLRGTSMIPFNLISRRQFATILSGIRLTAMVQWPVRADEAALVTIDNFSFTPQTIAVKIGTIVTFENHDDIPHTVVATDKSFRSKVLDTNEKYTFTFSTPGDFSYFCGLHPHMQGKVTVSR